MATQSPSPVPHLRTVCLHRIKCVSFSALLSALAATATFAQDADSGVNASDAMTGAVGGTGESTRPNSQLTPRDLTATEGSVAVLSARAGFERYGIRLDPAGEDALDSLVDQLDEFPVVLSIRVIGHADSRGNSEINLKLSEERATQVANNLRERFPDTHVISAGMGDSQPIADNATAEGRALNRRVEIQVIAAARHE